MKKVAERATSRRFIKCIFLLSGGHRNPYDARHAERDIDVSQSKKSGRLRKHQEPRVTSPVLRALLKLYSY